MERHPLPSIALNDPAFVRPILRNSWGGASQALTALRSPRWMEHYGRPADLAWMMQQWNSAILRHSEFRQQMDPLTGEFTQLDPGGYSPAALVFFDYTWRLSGVRLCEGLLEWNVRAPTTEPSKFSVKTSVGTAEMAYTHRQAHLKLNGKIRFSIQGTVRIITDMQGKLQEVVGTESKETLVILTSDKLVKRKISIRPNERIKI